MRVDETNERILGEEKEWASTDLEKGNTKWWAV
jgi:hypothetical protein